MHLLFKLGLVFLCCALSSATEEEVLRCNLRYCGSELLNFDKFSFGSLFRKIELAQFCIKNCTPPVVHEFFQSIVFSISKRIPGHCSGEECIDKNRFVALAKCVQEEAWPLLQCSKTLIDLAQIGLVDISSEEKRNTTCRIVTESVQCIEETLQRCGEVPFQLVKEIIGDLIRLGINAYCHPEYRKKGFFLKRTTGVPGATTLPPTTVGPEYKHPQFVKGYRTGSGHSSNLSLYCLLASICASIMFSVHRVRF